MSELLNIPSTSDSGVYEIVNISTGTSYIGSTWNFYERATVHKRELRAGRSSNKSIQQDVEKGANFMFKILTVLPKEINRETHLHIRLAEYEEIKRRLIEGHNIYNREKLKTIQTSIDNIKIELDNIKKYKPLYAEYGLTLPWNCRYAAGLESKLKEEQDNRKRRAKRNVKNKQTKETPKDKEIKILLSQDICKKIECLGVSTEEFIKIAIDEKFQAIS